MASLPDAANPAKAFEGTILVVRVPERDLKVKGLLFSKSFHLGEPCAVVAGEATNASLRDLRPGQRVRLCYTDRHGLLMASEVKQLPMVWCGRVAQFDPRRRTLTVQDGKQTKTFAVAADCKLIVRGDKEAAMESLRLGQRVTVVFESPATGLEARRVEQASETFTGTLTALDSRIGVVRAKRALGVWTFRLAPDCQVLLPDKTNADLADLRRGQEVTFTFEPVAGIKTVTCISSAEEAPKTAAFDGGAPFGTHPSAASGFSLRGGCRPMQ